MRKSLAFLCAFFVFCATQASAISPAAKISLVLNWVPEPQFGGFYAAQVEGIYKKKGLEVEIVPGGSGTPTVQMVAASQTPYAIASGEEVVVSRARGMDVTALYAVYQKNPVIIMTHAERGFKTLQDVFQADGVLAIQRGLPFTQFLLKKYGQPKATVVPNMAGIGPFLNDTKFSKQGFITSEPLLVANTKKGMQVKSFLVADTGFNPYLTVLITSANYLGKHEDEARKMVEAVREGWQAYLKDPSKTNAFMATLNPAMDANTFADSAKEQKSLIETEETQKDGLGVMKPERWKELAEQLKSIEVIKDVPDLSKIQKTW